MISGKHYHPLLLAIAFAYILYAPSLPFDFFIFDDSFHIFNNTFVNDPTFLELFTTWPESFQPIPYKIWQILSFFFTTEEARPFRLLNIFLHGINGYLLYIFLINLFSKINHKDQGEQYPIKLMSISASALFLCHPVNIESVVWASSLRGLLATFFSLVYFNIGIETRSDQEGGEFIKKAFLLTFLFSLALLSKLTIILIPLALLLIDALILRENKIRFYLYKYSPSLLLVGVAILLTEGKVYHLFESGNAEDFASNPSWIISTTFFENFKRLTLVSHQYMFQGLPPISAFNFSHLNISSTAFMLFYIILSIFMTALYFSRKNKTALTFLLIVFLSFLVVSGIVEFNFQNISLIADRYLYFPSLFFSPVVVLIAFQILKKIKLSERKMIITYSFIGAGLFVFTFNQIFLWRTSSSVLESSIKKNQFQQVLTTPYAMSLSKEGKKSKAFEFLKERIAKEDSQNGEEVSALLRIIKSQINYFNIKEFVSNLESFSFDPNSLTETLETFYSYGDIPRARRLLELYKREINDDSSTKQAVIQKLHLIETLRLFDVYFNASVIAQNKGDFRLALTLARKAKNFMSDSRVDTLIFEVKKALERQERDGKE